jgi:hypothetical protein
MTTARELFQRDKSLHESWSAVTHSDWFERVLVFADSAMLEGKCTTEEMAGARKFRDALVSLAEDDKAKGFYPKPRLNHNIDEPRKEVAKKPEPMKD